MLPFLTQPAVAPACYKPRAGSVIGQAQVFNGGQSLKRAMGAGDPTRWTFVTYFCPADLTTAAMSLFAARGVNDAVGRPHEANIELIGNTVSVYDFGRVTGTMDYQKTTTMVFRDPNAWHQLVVSLDTNVANADDRLKIELDGVRVDSFGTSVNPALGFAAGTFNSAVIHALGVCPNGWGDRYFFKGLQAYPMFISGHALPASVFGEFNIHGVWVPKPKADIYAAIAAAGGWGVNGCHLDFADPLDPGKDVSGQGNHWTADGFAPSGRDTVASTPTNVFASLNPLTLGYGTGSTITLSEGNLAVAFGGVNQSAVRASIDPSAAAKPVRIDATLTVLGLTTNTGLYVCGASYLANGALSNGATVATYGVNDTITGEYDPTSRVVRYYKNGVLQGTCAATGKTVAVAGGNSSWRINAGQRAWAYATPTVSGLCTDALREPDIKDPSEALAQATATGADIVSVLDALTAHWDDAWVEIIKRRDAAEDWRVRFADDPANAWATNNTNAKGPAAALAPGGAYVGYRLRVGQRYGVWTAEVEHVNGTPTTVTHGLDTARNMVIATRVSTDGGDRYCHHPDMPVGVLGKLNTNVQPAADGTLTAIEASSFEIAAGAPSGTYRVLVLAHRPGWLEIGSYKGTGQAGNNGAFDPMGIAPMWQLVKRLDNSGAWMLSSTALAPVNPMIRHLDLDKSNPEYTTGYDLDMVVGGVKYRTAGHSYNDTNGTYLRVAIGRPVGGVCVAPATAR